ncbi:MAG TPA: CpaF family protein [Candidatus Gallacutalibacter pullicola]|uniref:CpaF family protein n=1 Tax=Candidatus Gallacutalibacter pullicola TaxID=2840830 RepID=A0A9D1J255_9FIRM|nr:CpaF family protein [Candidatus Gallacutalibacter pullicola]
MTGEAQKELTKQLVEAVQQELNLGSLEDDALRREIDGMLDRAAAGQYLSLDQRVAIVGDVYARFRGFGPLDAILRDDSVTEIMVNGPQHIFIERKGEILPLDRSFESEEALLQVIRRITRLGGREVNQSSPIVDTRLPDGSRVNVVLKPIALNGHILTIRKFSSEPMTMERLIRYGSLTPEIASFLERLVKARYNIFISGGTGSGKTTFLNALSNYIPRSERVITIEDSAELTIEGVENLVTLETRNATASAENAAITIRDLIRASLRMRPDRIIVGEVRGGEALDMLQAMNTGHDGSLSTGHANSAEDMLSRLETMVLQGSEALPLAAIRQQISSALDIIVHLGRLRDHSRKTLMIAEVRGIDPASGMIRLNPLYEFHEDLERSSPHHVEGRLERTEHAMENTAKLQMAGLQAGI